VNKDTADGTFYRSKHELVFVFKNGKAPHINNFELGQGGAIAPTLELRRREYLRGGRLEGTCDASDGQTGSLCSAPFSTVRGAPASFSIALPVRARLDRRENTGRRPMQWSWTRNTSTPPIRRWEPIREAGKARPAAIKHSPDMQHARCAEAAEVSESAVGQ